MDQVHLEIFSERENVDKLAHAMASLQRSMRWDEAVYGLEYDLDIYNIVAVNDFNMGAMENKVGRVCACSCMRAWMRVCGGRRKAARAILPCMCVCMYVHVPVSSRGIPLHSILFTAGPERLQHGLRAGAARDGHRHGLRAH